MILDLQKAAKEGDPKAIESIVSEHRSQIRAMAWKMDAGRMLFDDLQSEGLIGILQAIEKNDPTKKCDLKPLVGQFARFRMWNFLRKDQTYHRRILLGITIIDAETGEIREIEPDPDTDTPAEVACRNEMGGPLALMSGKEAAQKMMQEILAV